jgi:hypothetical protein
MAETRLRANFPAKKLLHRRGRPQMYCPSMVKGVTSLRGVMPLESKVTKEKV